jgi:quercetin dioxygenase-like cupin family protein
MNAHTFLDDDLREQAALFVLGSLAEDDARRWRLHIARCLVCREEVLGLERVSGELAIVAPAVAPPPQLWQRVLERVRQIPRPLTPIQSPATDAGEPIAGHGIGQDAGQVWKQWPAADAERGAFTYVDEDAGAFQPTSFSGISARRLFVDRERDRVTMLVRMEPGSAYPAHRHGGPEDCFVLQGDLEIADDSDAGERELRAGDFVRSAPGSVHGVQSTRAGCLLFLVSSLNDELLA